MLVRFNFPKNGMSRSSNWHRSNRLGYCDRHWGRNLYISYTLLRSVFWVGWNLDVADIWIMHIARVVNWVLNVARVVAWHIHRFVVGLI